MTLKTKKTPCGVELQEGQRWREMDERNPRIVTVLGWDRDKVLIKGEAIGSVKRWASLKRFNGQRSGYMEYSAFASLAREAKRASDQQEANGVA